jgi:hypothetical protein
MTRNRLVLASWVIQVALVGQAQDLHKPIILPKTGYNWAEYKSAAHKHPKVDELILGGALKVIASDLDRKTGTCTIVVENVSGQRLPGMAFLRFYDGHGYAVLRGPEIYWCLELEPKGQRELTWRLPAPWVVDYGIEIRQLIR